MASVTIPNSVINIGERLFEGCSSLTTVTIPGSVTNIGDGAFSSCSSLTRVAIPNSVTTIGYAAFSGCSSLTSVTVPNSVTTIGDWAFASCASLTSVTIPTGVTIPSSVTSIGDRAFANCGTLTAITVDSLNPAYSSLDGILLNKSKSTLLEYPGGKYGFYAIPNGVTSIGQNAFMLCAGLTGVTIPNSVTSIGNGAFSSCSSLTSVIIPPSVANLGANAFSGCASLTTISIPESLDYIGPWAFGGCASLTNVNIAGNVVTIANGAFQSCASLRDITIPESVARIMDYAFFGCTNLEAVYFCGDAPILGGRVFDYCGATVYFLPGTAGWGPTFGGRPTALWVEAPAVLMSPMTQTAEAGSAVSLWAAATNSLPLFYLWYFNGTNLLSSSTNGALELTNVQFAQRGDYTVVISNALGAVTSAPAMLNVIAPVERRLVPGVNVTGEVGSLLNVDYADSLSPAPNWITLGSVSLTNPSQYWFDPTLPLPPQRFYRSWQTGTLSVIPSLDLHLIPALTLTGSIGSTMRVDAINQFGPTDAWFMLDTVTLMNTSQLYFDVSVIGQPPRLYRLVQVP